MQHFDKHLNTCRNGVESPGHFIEIDDEIKETYEALEEETASKIATAVKFKSPEKRKNLMPQSSIISDSTEKYKQRAAQQQTLLPSSMFRKSPKLSSVDFSFLCNKKPNDSAVAIQESKQQPEELHSNVGINAEAPAVIKELLSVEHCDDEDIDFGLGLEFLLYNRNPEMIIDSIDIINNLLCPE